ncbi:MAG: hypothetical protein AAF517_27810, partial [Planctomycetota bacterium]
MKHLRFEGKLPFFRHRISFPRHLEAYIGRTAEVTTQPGVLTVSPALTWPVAIVPSTGHNCMIAISGSKTETALWRR